MRKSCPIKFMLNLAEQGKLSIYLKWH